MAALLPPRPPSGPRSPGPQGWLWARPGARGPGNRSSRHRRPHTTAEPPRGRGRPSRWPSNPRSCPEVAAVGTRGCPRPRPGQGPPCGQGAVGAAAGRAQPSPRAHMGAPDVASVPQLEREPPPEERGEEVEEEKEEEGFNGSPELPPLSAPPPPLPRATHPQGHHLSYSELLQAASLLAPLAQSPDGLAPGHRGCHRLRITGGVPPAPVSAFSAVLNVRFRGRCGGGASPLLALVLGAVGEWRAPGPPEKSFWAK